MQSAVASGTSNPQPGGPVIRTFQLPPPGVPPRLKRRERNPAADGGTMGEKFPRILTKVGSFTCRKFTTWDRRLYFPSEGRRAEHFFARKIRRLRPGFNPRTWVLKASTLTSRPPIVANTGKHIFCQMSTNLCFFIIFHAEFKYVVRMALLPMVLCDRTF